MIARDNDTRAALNTAAREQLRTQGQLGDDADYRPVTVAVGDRIICRRNDHLAGVERRQRADWVFRRGLLRAGEEDTSGSDKLP